MVTKSPAGLKVLSASTNKGGKVTSATDRQIQGGTERKDCKLFIHLLKKKKKKEKKSWIYIEEIKGKS